MFPGVKRVPLKNIRKMDRKIPYFPDVFAQGQEIWMEVSLDA